jgi:hypothetical protein
MVIAAKIDVLPAQWRQMCQIAECRMLLLCFMIIDGSLQVGRQRFRRRVAAERSALRPCMIALRSLAQGCIVDHNFSRKRATQVLLSGISECCGSASTQEISTC